MDGERQYQRVVESHQPEVIRRRLERGPRARYLGDGVLGGIDGCITTFAVVAGAKGAGFPEIVVIALGFANLVADGFSMAVSNYERALSDVEALRQSQAAERLHTEVYPEGQHEEVRQIFYRKGFSGEALERIVETVASNREMSIDTVAREHAGVGSAPGSPLAAALVTLSAFLVVGSLPLLPFLVPGGGAERFGVSLALTAVVFFAIGMAKGLVLAYRPWVAGVRTLLVGGGAALLAYAVGLAVRQWTGMAAG